jgi:hypothetical protein
VSVKRRLPHRLTETPRQSVRMFLARTGLRVVLQQRASGCSKLFFRFQLKQAPILPATRHLGLLYTGHRKGGDTFNRLIEELGSPDGDAEVAKSLATQLFFTIIDVELEKANLELEKTNLELEKTNLQLEMVVASKDAELLAVLLKDVESVTRDYMKAQGLFTMRGLIGAILSCTGRCAFG